jgi:hypothetical protein
VALQLVLYVLSGSTSGAEGMPAACPVLEPTRCPPRYGLLQQMQQNTSLCTLWGYCSNKLVSYTTLTRSAPLPGVASWNHQLFCCSGLLLCLLQAWDTTRNATSAEATSRNT